ncbi:MAG: 4-hydroxythreonine-4-phosphate dehydrogenase PdxA [Rhodospirillaceae bacterium]|nr:4-hydroxythreonine-4-phosphate dehydrogenase PdxA [Rhodospirillaceae bacterium]
MTDRRVLLAVTMGEPAGIGGELTLQAWAARHVNGPAFLAIDNSERLRILATSLGYDIPIKTITSAADAGEVFPTALPVLEVPMAATATLGKPSPATAAAVIEAIEVGVRLAVDGEVDGIVTNPIQKHVLYAVGFTHPGHTEFLADLSRSANPPVMMLASSQIDPCLRVVPVTIHVGLRRALDLLTPGLIAEQLRLTHAALISDFAISNPRIAVAGLNPHAGESGSMGNEETDIIAPVVAELRAEGINVTGPLPPDTLFAEQRRSSYDAAICMYHDQALIPIKTLDFSGGVNITLGLPIVRTSPDHGTALEIAGAGKADPTSFLAALDVAAELASNRAVD